MLLVTAATMVELQRPCSRTPAGCPCLPGQWCSGRDLGSVKNTKSHKGLDSVRDSFLLRLLSTFLCLVSFRIQLFSSSESTHYFYSSASASSSASLSLLQGKNTLPNIFHLSLSDVSLLHPAPATVLIPSLHLSLSDIAL